MTDLRLHALFPVLLAVGGLAYVYHLAVAAATVQIAVEGGQVQFEPATVRLRVTIPPDPANRTLTVAAIADGFTMRRSDEQLDGSSPRTRWLTWADLPAGEYIVLAHVTRGAAPAWQAQTRVVVLARGV